MIFENTTIFDLETSGLDPTKGATILEVGALRIRHGQVVGSYTELVNPAHPVPEVITKITGITDSDVVGCRSVEQVVTSLLDFMGDSLLIGYNVAFDLRFLHDYSPAGRWSIMNDFLDAQGMAIHALPYRSHKLTETCKDLGIELNGAHRALADVEATWKITKALWQTPRGSMMCPLEWYKNKVLHCRKYANDPPFLATNAELVLVG